MAKQSNPDMTVTSAGYDDSDYQWENVHEEAPDQIVFEDINDKYTGRYLGKEVIEFDDNKGEHQTFTQLRFRDPQGLKVINAGYELEVAFKEIPEGSLTRIVLMKLVPIAGQQSPMKSYRVDVARETTTA